MPEKLKNILDKVLNWWKKFTLRQKTLIGGIAAVIVLAIIILAVVMLQPTWVTLATCESTKEASEIVDLLDGEDIEYKTSDDGMIISVKSPDEAKAHLVLGSNSISSDGYSIDNVFDGGFSTTESDKEKKYQLYLEEKLSKELETTLDAVDSARVNLSIPDSDGTILSQQEETYAAVTLTLNSEDFSEDEAASVAKYIATAIGDDGTENVTIMNSDAKVLYSGADSDSSSVVGLTASEQAIRQKAEQDVKSQVKDVILGSELYENVNIGLNLDMDFDQVNISRKEYDVAEGNTQGYLDSNTTYNENTTGGYTGVPGTDSNDETTYVIDNEDYTVSTVEEVTNKYLVNETNTDTIKAIGTVNPEESSMSVVATRYHIYDEDTMKQLGELDNTTFEEFVAANGDEVPITVDDETLQLLSTATGIPTDSITVLAYEVPFFQYSEGGRNITDYLQFIIAAAILIMLGFVIFRSTRSQAGEEELEPELSVESLLESTRDENENLEEIGFNERSEARILIEKFIDENPAAVASLLRNWIEEADEWE